MIYINEICLEFKGMGLFTTDKEWVHPTVSETTHEIIYVTQGEVHIEESGAIYSLKKGDLLILEPNKEHRGFKTSHGHTAFYWMHFNTNHADKLIKGKKFLSCIKKDYLFKEMLHHSYLGSKDMTELLLAQLIIENTYKESVQERKLINDVFEWTRINASPELRIGDIAKHFDYNEEHLTRLIKKKYSKGLKQLINDFIIERAKSLLVNTNYSIKEIATQLEFNDANTFVKYFKYHIKMTPSEYKNSYSATHMNKK